MKSFAITASAALALLQACALAGENPSALWAQFKEGKAAGLQSALPDFSYAGYKRGEQAIPDVKGPLFNVKDYGAFPDDLKDDAKGIEAAIKAASAAGGGVVFLPKGRYLVNTSMESRSTIYIESDRIVLRGEGSREGGTVIHAIHPYGGNFAPDDINRMHLGDNLFVIRSKEEDKPLASKEVLCKVAAGAASGGFSVTVDDASRVKAGDMVCLYALNKEIFKRMVEPYALDPEWTTIERNAASTVELHRVKAVDGVKVVFEEPVLYELQDGDGWTLRPFKPVREVGVEDICFMGNAHQRYIHHRNDMDDAGWSFVKAKGVVDGWARRCSFIDCSQTLCVALSLNFSMLDIVVAGNPGHHIPRAVYFDYGVLGGLIEDRAGCTHGPSLQGGSLGTVYWRCESASPGAPDCHAGRPYVSLFDLCSGDKLSPTGGFRDFPQHLRGLVLWNYEQKAKEPVVEYDFWVKGKSNCYVKPVLSGFHGTPASFNPEHVGVMESPGAPVSPSSLYEAQLASRLGAAPAWIADAKRDFEALRAKPLPRHFEKDAPKPDDFLFPERFKAAAAAKYLTTLSLQPYNSKQFACDVKDPSIELDMDQNMLRNAVFSLMYCVYSKGKEGNAVSLARSDFDGRPWACFAVKSGKKLDAKALERDVDFRYAKVFASKIGAKVRISENPASFALELLAPIGKP